MAPAASPNGACCEGCANGDLPVPRPIAARYTRSGLAYRADLITEELPSRLTLAQALAARPLDPAELAGRRTVASVRCTPTAYAMRT